MNLRIRFDIHINSMFLHIANARKKIIMSNMELQIHMKTYPLHCDHHSFKEQWRVQRPPADIEFQIPVSFQSFCLFVCLILIIKGAFPEDPNCNNHILTLLNKFWYIVDQVFNSSSSTYQLYNFGELFNLSMYCFFLCVKCE